MKSKSVTLKPTKKKTAEVFQIQVMPGHVIKIHENSKYLLILPKDAKINSEFETALKKFFGTAHIFVLAVNDITQYKLAEIYGPEVGGAPSH